MDEDEEEFYDSLEEDQNYEDTYSHPPEEIVIPNEDLPDYNIVSENKNPSNSNEITLKNQKSQSSVIDSDDGFKKGYEKTTKIPLYVGEVDKKDLKINKKVTQNLHQTSSTCLSCDASGKFRTKIDNGLQKKKQESSYWNLYCQKNKLSDDEGTTDTVRSMYGSTTNRTFTSLISSCCLSGQTWDAPSMFEKYIPKKYGSPNKVRTYDETDRESTNEDLDLDNFKSVSQIDIKKTSASPSKMSANKIAKSKSNTSNISQRPLSLKTLCPNQSKLELIRRQQEYGHRASSRNRARFIQNLSKLKQEVQNNSKVSKINSH